MALNCPKRVLWAAGSCWNPDSVVVNCCTEHDTPPPICCDDEVANYSNWDDTTASPPKAWLLVPDWNPNVSTDDDPYWVSNPCIDCCAPKEVPNSWILKLEIMLN